MSEKIPSINRSSFLKLRNPKNDLISYYDDLQSDYKKYLNLFFEWSCIPYIDENNVVHHKEELENKLATDFSKFIDINLLRSYTKNIFGDQKQSSSSYNIFYANFHNIGAKIPKEIQLFFEDLNKDNFNQVYNELVSRYNQPIEDIKSKFSKIELEIQNLSPEDKKGLSKLQDKLAACKERYKDNLDFLEDKLFKFNKISKNDWESIAEEIINVDQEKIKKKKISIFWERFKDEFSNESRSLGKEIRNVLGITCKQHNNSNYCRQLFEMIRISLSSTNAKCEEHVKETNNIKNNIKLLESKVNHLASFLKLLEKLKQNQMKFNFYFVKNCFEKSEGNVLKYNDNIIHELLEDEEYQDLFSFLFVKENNKFVNVSLYEKLSNLKTKLEKRKDYPRFYFDHKDAKVPFGVNYYNFLINNYKVKISNFNEFDILKSNYFGDLKLTKQDTGYELEFYHQVKNKNPVNYGQKINGLVKQIGLLKKNDSYYLSFDYSIKKNVVNDNIKYFMCSADIEKIKSRLESLPDTITCAAIDLNISNPITACKAKIYKNDFGKSLKSLLYGSGNFIDLPKFLVQDGQYNRDLIKLTNDCKTLVSLIRSFKEIKNNKKQFDSLTKEEINFLGLENNDPNFRHKIQRKLSEINKAIKKYSFLLRSEGYKNLSDSIRLLQAKDGYASLVNSYERIHLKPGEMLNQEKKFDQTRAEFRELITRKLAYKLVEYCVDCNILFIENLNFDPEKDKNHLLKLFNCRTLIKYITEALEKRGVAVVEVDKSGTSKVDPVTGQLGYRSKKDKSKLYVKRNGKIVYLDSDLAACVNVMLKGLGHSVCPYSFIKSNDDEIENGKQRIKTFKMLTKIDFKNKERVYCYNPEKIIIAEEQKSILNEFEKEIDIDNFINNVEHADVLSSLNQECKAFSAIY